jgi:WD40 repeat protein
VTGALLRIFAGHGDAIYSVAVSADDSLIISGSDDNSIRIWDMTTGALVRILRPNAGCFRCVACSPKQNWVITGDDDKLIRLWDISDGFLPRTIIGHSGRVICVAFSESGEWIVSGDTDHVIRVWNAESGALRVTLKGHFDSISSVAFFPDGRRILSQDGWTTRIWDMETGSLLLTRRFEWLRVVSSVSFPLVNEVATGSNGDIYIWDAENGDLLRVIEASPSNLDSLIISQDGTRIVSGGRDVQVWQAQGSSEIEPIWSVDSATFSPNGSRVITTMRHKLHLWDALTGTLLRTLVGHTDLVRSTSFSADSAQLLSGSVDQTIRLWDVDTGIGLKTLSGHSDVVWSVEFFHSGARCVSGSLDRTIRIWDTAIGITIRIIEMGPSHELRRIAISPNGGHLAVPLGHVVQMWDLAGGGLQKTLEGHSANVTRVAFSADGNQIVSSDLHHTIRIWEATTGVEMTVFNNIKGAGTLLDRLMFSPDQKCIFTNIGPCSIPKEYLTVRRSENAGGLLVPCSPGYFMRDGWLWTQDPNRRICWIPPAWRPGRCVYEGSRLAWQGNHVVFATPNRLVFINTTDVVNYLHFY